MYNFAVGGFWQWPFARILHETPASIIWVDGNLAGVHMAHNINESILRVVVDEANHRG